jgi:hypothetical protein
MALVSTRTRDPEPAGAAWPLGRSDLDSTARALLEKAAHVAPLPPHLFGERGLQTSGDEARALASALDARRTFALRVGADMGPFRLGRPSLFADPAALPPRFRPSERWAAVRVLVRQTARRPIAALSDGLAFRNSLLAGFDDAEHSAEFLVAYLNTSIVGWLHYVRHRDARQGIPQVKVAHLRAIPAPPRRELASEIARFGRDRSLENAGMTRAQSDELDALGFDAFDLSSSERDLVASWARSLR